jgi:RND family efflux transporter MFP subunit
MRKFTFGALVVVAALAGIGLSFYASRPTESATANKPAVEPVVVEAARVERRSFEDRVELAATVEAQESVAILPKVSGILEEIHVDLGDKVEQGQLIARIEDEQFVRRLDQAQANLQLGIAQVKKAQLSFEAVDREFKRTEASKREGLISDQELDAVRARHDAASADLNIATAESARAKSAHEEAQWNLRNTQIPAPISGVIDQRQVDAGTLVSPQSTLCTIVQLDPVRVRAHVPENRLGVAETGQTAQIDITSLGLRTEGKVERVAPTINTLTQTSEIIVQAANGDGKLRPGMSAKVTFVKPAREGVLVIPINAVQQSASESSVVRITKDSSEHVAVKLGSVVDGLVEVREGLSEGDLVVLKGQFMIREGDPVRYVLPDGAKQG